MRTPRIAIALLCLGAGLGSPVQASAETPAPAWQLISTSMPTHFAPGEEGEIFVLATNLGGEATSGLVTVTDTLPAGITPTNAVARDNDPNSPDPTCGPVVGQAISCTDPDPFGSGRQFEVRIFVDIALGTTGTLFDDAAVSGGGPTEVKTKAPIPISSTPPPFAFLPAPAGLSAPIIEADGFPATLSGSHPYQLTTNLGFPTEKVPGGLLEAAGHPQEIVLDLPRGTIVNPTATPVLCTEAELSSFEGCPPDSQIGTIAITTVAVTVEAATTPVFNMVPPPGKAANIGFNALDIGVFVHVSGGVRSDGDFGLSGTVSDLLALPLHPVFGSRVDLWGDPTSSLHDKIRGICAYTAGISCPATEKPKTALLTLPGDCLGKATVFRAHAKSWEDPGDPAKAEYESADLDGTPTPIDGCNGLEFKPKINAAPTTNLTDSPSGFDLTLHQPQNQNLGSRSTASVKDTVLTLPEGLVVNPAAASGQAACSPTQIGLTTKVGQSPASFNKNFDGCPDAAKVGTLEATTPLLAQVSEDGTKVLRDPEGNPIPRPLKGELFLAEPFQNPFSSLLALYLVIEDPQSGTVAKLAAKVSANPITGQLTNTLIESPQLPIEDVRVHVFGGPRAALRTAPACAPYTTTAQLTPWSAPQAPSESASDDFTLAAAAGGGPCPASANTAPNKPTFSAGTLSPQAGAYSPFVLKVTREDGSQPISGFEATLPKGLTAKLAGIPYCSEAQIAQAQSRNAPNEGKIEQASPSCPQASEVGSVEVTAGAGPNPYATSGRIYLSGPYKGAPLSFVVIAPAVAGPFDLGTVAVRAAAYLNPETAIVRAVSDPLPTILEGIPLDIRSTTVRMLRPQFTLNPTSCDPTQVLATTTSIFAQPAALSAPFQVGGCASLPFKPKFSFKLKGATKRTGHPKLIVTGSFKAGQANLERAAIAFPRSEFLDQAHIGTVCTRVQFAAKQCPARSVYGFAKASTPLLDKPLEGPVYLRSSSHELPDVVLALSGQVEVVLGSRVDSLNGGIRVTAEGVPDAPVTDFRIEMKGGRKGLLINSTNLCAKPNYAAVKLDGQNGKVHDFKALMKNECGKKDKGKKR